MDSILFIVHRFLIKTGLLLLKRQKKLLEFQKFKLNEFSNIEFQNKAISNLDNSEINFQ